jgi:ABC-type lipoprotein release transport system permease subunit
MWRNWRRSLIAMLAIVLGMILLLFMDGMISSSDQAIYGNAVRLYGGNIQVHAPGFREKAKRLPLLPLDDPEQVMQVIRAETKITSASSRINTTGTVSSRGVNYPVTITAVEPSIEATNSIVAEYIESGRYLLDDDEASILIGRGLADLLDVNMGDRVTLVGRRKEESMRQHTMTIVGIYNLGLGEAEKGTVFINLPMAQTLYNLRDQVTEITITLDSLGNEEAIIKSLQPRLPGYEVDSWQTLRPEMRETMDTKSGFTTFFSFVVLLIAIIGVLNLMLMAVFERTREMGVLAALGMKGRQIILLFVLEGSLIGIVGAFFGCALGALIVSIVGIFGIDLSFASGMGEITALMGTHLYPSVTLGNVISRGISVAFITALASLYPAWQASKNEPSESLRYV